MDIILYVCVQTCKHGYNANLSILQMVASTICNKSYKGIQNPVFHEEMLLTS